jgi:hypothetical protein
LARRHRWVVKWNIMRRTKKNASACFKCSVRPCQGEREERRRRRRRRIYSYSMILRGRRPRTDSASPRAFLLPHPSRLDGSSSSSRLVPGAHINEAGHFNVVYVPGIVSVEDSIELLVFGI